MSGLRWSEEMHADWKARQAKRYAAEASAPPGAVSAANSSRSSPGGGGPDERPFRLTRPEPAEAAVLASVLKALRLHPRVAFAYRFNSGAFRVGEPGNERWFRAGFVGCPDILGMLKGGTFISVECKKPSGRVSPEQAAFIELVNKAGGKAFVARRADDVMRELA